MNKKKKRISKFSYFNQNICYWCSKNPSRRSDFLAHISSVKPGGQDKMHYVDSPMECRSGKGYCSGVTEFQKKKE